MRVEEPEDDDDGEAEAHRARHRSRSRRVREAQAARERDPYAAASSNVPIHREPHRSQPFSDPFFGGGGGFFGGDDNSLFGGGGLLGGGLFGGGGRDIFRSMDRMFSDMDRLMRSGNAYSVGYSSTSVMGPDGHTYHRIETSQGAPGGLRHVQEKVRDSRVGQERVRVTRALGPGQERTTVRTVHLADGREEVEERGGVPADFDQR